MKNAIPAIIAFLGCLNAFGQTRLVIRGDDMGFSHSGNEALIKCFKEGVETSIEVIVPSPWFPEAVTMLQQNPGIDVGVHLAITSEWDNVKWRPLTNAISLRDARGYFFPMVSPNTNYPGQSIRENQWTVQDIEMEFRAQIELAKKLIPRVSHVSTHMGCAYITDEVKTMTSKLAKEYGLGFDADYDVTFARWEGTHITAEEKISSFMAMLDKFENGKSYIFVEHPGLDNEELRAIHHIGYENVATDRQGVTDLFINSKVKAAIQKKGILLVNYKVLKSR